MKYRGYKKIKKHTKMNEFADIYVLVIRKSTGEIVDRIKFYHMSELHRFSYEMEYKYRGAYKVVVENIKHRNFERQPTIQEIRKDKIDNFLKD